MGRVTWDLLRRTDHAGQIDLLTGEALEHDVVRPAERKAPAPTVEETGALPCPTLFDDEDDE